MKRLAILGSTGSIGKSTLEVVKSLPGEFQVVALSANNAVDLLFEQAREFGASSVCINDPAKALAFEKRLGSRRIRVYARPQGLVELVKDKRVDMVVMAVSRLDALMPLLSAIESGKDIALANKEALVSAGSLVMAKVKAKGVNLVPIDSEQSAVWQCLQGNDPGQLRQIYLTASGGPLLKLGARQISLVRPKDVLKHPRWNMGKKITVDSATMMNKGLEVLEAMALFDLDISRIKVLVHPEAIIHSMVEFRDGVVMAQLSVTDMCVPIQYALTYPRRLDTFINRLDFYQLKALHFQQPDTGKFPCLGLAYEAARQKGTMPAVLNAANEVCVEEFLAEKISFPGIAGVVEKVLAKHQKVISPRLADILAADAWARQEAQRVIQDKRYRLN